MSGGFIREPGTLLPTRMEGLPFRQANRFCMQQQPGAHLLVVNDLEELQFIFNWVPSVEPLEVWIGLYYNITTMRYEWVNGDPVFFTAWDLDRAEPQIQEGGAALMFASEFFTPQITQLYGYGLEVSHFWISEMMDEPYPFICEYNMPLVATPDPGFNDTTNSTASTPAQGPVTFSPQILYQQEPQPVRLSQFIDLGGIQERVFGQERRGGARPAVPQQYRKRGRFAESRAQRYGYRYPVLP